MSKVNEKRKKRKNNKAKDEEVNGQGGKRQERGFPGPTRRPSVNSSFG